MFDEEFSELPVDTSEALKKRLEHIIRMISKRYSLSLYDRDYRNYSGEQLSAMVGAIFDLAARLKAKDLNKSS